MTIAKFLCRLSALLLLAVLLVPTLLSCRDEQSIEPPFELLDEEAEEEIISEEEKYTRYRIVISSACSPELWNAAKELQFRLSQKTGIPCEIVYDKETLKQSKDIFEILLGNTARPASQRALRELRENDYLCQPYDNALVLGGPSDGATISALNRFYKELLSYATASSLLPNGGGFLYHADYPIKTITLGGFDLALFDIVYPQNAPAPLTELAALLQQKLASIGNYFLAISPESEFTGASKRIYFTLSDQEEYGVACIRFDDQGVTLSACDLFGLSAATKELCLRLLPEAEESVSFGTPNSVETVPYDNQPQTIASLLIDSTNDPVTEVTNMTDLVQTNTPDVIITKNLSHSQRTWFDQILQEQYFPIANTESYQSDNTCRVLSEDLEGGVLYHIGNDHDGYLLLALFEVPSEELLQQFRERTLPMILVVHAPFFDKERLGDAWERTLFDSYFSKQEQTAFAVYAEPNCFLIREKFSQNGYRSFFVERTSAFYS